MLLWQGSIVEIDYGFFGVFGPYFIGKSLGTFIILIFRLWSFREVYHGVRKVYHCIRKVHWSGVVWSGPSSILIKYMGWNKQARRQTHQYPDSDRPKGMPE